MRKAFLFVFVFIFAAAFYPNALKSIGQQEMEMNHMNKQGFGGGFDTTRNAWWYGGQGKEQYENREFEEAITNLSYAITIDSNISDFYYYRGNSYALNHQPAKALVDFKKALELNPDYLSNLNNLGWEYLKRREFRGAFQYFFNYLKSFPKDPRNFFRFNLNEEYILLLNNLGWQSIRTNDLPKAIRYFKNYINVAQNDPDAYLGLALIYFEYGDVELATENLYKAKNLEPALYEGFDGILVLESSNYSYSGEDKMRLKNMFDTINDVKRDLKNMTTDSAGRFLMSFVYIVLGIIAFVIFILRIKRFEIYIFYLGLLNISFGLKFMSENPLVKLTEFPTANFWGIGMPIINLIIPIVFILFVRYFIGWGWKRSILWLLILSVVQGIVKILFEYFDPGLDIYYTSDTIFGFLATVVLFFHMFLPEMRKNREVQVISGGLGFYLLANFYDNLAQMQWISDKFSFDDSAYLFFNLCLVYVAFSRIAKTEKEYLAVKQDLETARNIQNGILPERNPKGDLYEVSSAYLPMVLIGGDYYDYQLHDESHVGVLVADVSGHGISAALIASMLKVAFTSQRNNSKLPSVVLQQINKSLTGQLNNEFITAGYYGIDLKNKKLTYSSAGHPPLVIFNRKNNEIKELWVKGIPIGVFPETDFMEETITLEKGDRLLLYTDGILDVINNSNEMFGKDRFFGLIKDSKNLMVEDTTKTITQAIRDWSGKELGEAFEDDITLVIFDVL
ncbi:MAG: SpoIIE family protein phosphatase [Salinivirgaceae bacterium]|nr:SpoIIE family protein phosphatase [Salinivirgaceae bacterium]